MKINAVGYATISKSGDILDVYYPEIDFNGLKTDIKNSKNLSSSKKLIELNWNQDDLDGPVKDVSSAYLKLHLISYKFVKPNSINLDGLFSALPNVAWTNQGPISTEEINERLLDSKLNDSNLYVRSLDKFPPQQIILIQKIYEFEMPQEVLWAAN